LLRRVDVFARRSLVSFLALVLTAAAIHGAEHNSKKVFLSSWHNQAVVLKRPLYSLVFSERSRFLPVVRRDGRISGLTIATPTETYYQFAARRDYEEDIVERTPDAVLATLKTRYRRSAHLDEGSVHDVEVGMLVRYEPGVQLVVGRVQIEGDEVRLFLRRADEASVATTLTVKLAGPLSKDLVEAPLIDQVLNRFVSKNGATG
jgi:hypothetical protein